MLTTRISGLASMHAAVLLATLVGCSDSKGGQSDQSPSFETDPKSLQAALETPIIDCQDAYADCRTGAADADGRSVCRDDFRSCLSGAADKGTTGAAKLVTCRDEGLQCVRDGGELSDCRAQYTACNKAVVEEGGGDVAVDAPVDDGGAPAERPERPSIPSLRDRLDGGTLTVSTENLPDRVKCVAELRLCVAGDPGAVSECADTARACLNVDTDTDTDTDTDVPVVPAPAPAP
jgi:hypothetical protein